MDQLGPLSVGLERSTPPVACLSLALAVTGSHSGIWSLQELATPEGLGAFLLSAVTLVSGLGRWEEESQSVLWKQCRVLPEQVLPSFSF